VVWENWIEQAQMYPTDPSNGLVVPNAAAAGSSAVHLLHGSPLALLKNATLSTVVPGLLGGLDQNCNKARSPPKRSAQPNDLRGGAAERLHRGLHRRHQFVES